MSGGRNYSQDLSMDEFVRNYLNFLNDSFEDWSFTDVCVEPDSLLDDEALLSCSSLNASIYEGSKMATSLTETWSSSSSGSITSVTEYPSKYYRRHCRSEVKYAVAANPNEDAFFGNPNRFDSKTSTPRISEEPMFGRSNFCDRRSSTPKLGYHGVETTVQKFMESFQVAERQPRRLNLNESTDEAGLAPRESFSGCKFCRKNGEPAVYYNSHVLKEKSGKVICPILSKYVCPLCGATGSNAHTRRYCKNENTFGRNRRGFV